MPRAHQHSAGARRHAGHRGLWQVTRKPPMGEPSDHAIGRSRGGLTTKVHALTDQREEPRGDRLTAGQAGDNPQLVPLLDDYFAESRPRCRRARPRLPAARRQGVLASEHTNRAASPRDQATPSPSAKTKSPDGRPKDQPEAGHPRSTPRSTACATPSNAASTDSNNGAASQPATTNTHSPTSEASSSPAPIIRARTGTNKLGDTP